MDNTEKAFKEMGVDPERVEEAIDPGVHARALSASGADHEAMEEKVHPGLHKQMANILSYTLAHKARRSS
jgi:hypothetical protein